MANLCYTEVTINGKYEELREIEKMVEGVPCADAAGIHFADILVALGEDPKQHKCRGFISYMSLEDEGDYSQLFIDIGSAWLPQLYTIKALVDRYAPEAEIMFTAEEEGCEVYVTNDSAYVNEKFRYVSLEDYL